MTVADVGERMTSTELLHWKAFFKLENEEIEAKRKTPGRKSNTGDDLDD